MTATTALWRVVCAVAAVLFVAGLGLLVLAVYLPLPGWFALWSEPTAWEPIALQVALAVLAFGAWVWPNRHRQRAFSLVFLALGTATVLVLGAAGYLRCPDPSLSIGWSTVSRVLGLLIGNLEVEGFAPGGTCGGGVPLALQLARLVAVLVLVVAASRALAALFTGQIDRIRVRLARRISLVVGADAASASLLPALAVDRTAATPVVLTQDASAPWVRRARASGWRIVTGDPADPATITPLLRRGRLRHALTSLAVLPADASAGQRLVRAVEQALGPYTGSVVRALVRIDDAWQAEDLRRRYRGLGAEWIIDTIGLDEVTGRLIVDDVVRVKADRVVIVGRSGLSYALLAELAQQDRESLILDEPRLPAVVVVDATAAEILEQHAFSQSRFGNQADIRARAVESAATLAVIEDAAAGATLPAIVFAGESDEASRRLAALLGARSPAWFVYSRQPGVEGLGRDPLLARVYAFGSTLDTGGRTVGIWERLARLGHEGYVRRYGADSAPSRQPWDALSPFYRSSNVRQVLATMAGAVAVGRSWGAGHEAFGDPSPEQLDRMTELEHESWTRHLADHGWRFGDRRDDRRRRHPDLVAWEELGEQSREITRAGVLSSLELLATAGYRSFDNPVAAWRTVRRRGLVRARLRREDWDWTTSDGQVLHGSEGDWEVFDDRGRGHAVAAAVFESSHERINGEWWRRVGTVQVRPAREGERIATLEGDLVANAGEWIVRGDLGEEWIISTERLDAGYEAPDLSE